MTKQEKQQKQPEIKDSKQARQFAYEKAVIQIRLDIVKDSAFGHAFQLAMAHYMQDEKRAYEPEWESNVARTILSNWLFARVDFPSMMLGSQWYPQRPSKTE